MTKDEAKKLYIKFGWKILEAKFHYYEGGKYNLKPLYPDEKYDELERRYKKLAGALKLPTSACDSVGFPFDRPSGRLVADKILSKIKKARV